jgi:hypothetical protein
VLEEYRDHCQWAYISGLLNLNLNNHSELGGLENNLICSERDFPNPSRREGLHLAEWQNSISNLPLKLQTDTVFN